MTFKQLANRVFSSRSIGYTIGIALVGTGGFIGLFCHPAVAAGVIGLGCGILWTTSQRTH